MMFNLESVYFQKKIRYVSCIHCPNMIIVEIERANKNSPQVTFQDQKSMFRKYNKLGCIFECRLRYALRHVNCIPWDYPLPLEHQEVPICVSKVQYKAFQVPGMVPNVTEFHNLMVSKESLQDCNCWDDCEGVTYELQVGSHQSKSNNKLF